MGTRDTEATIFMVESDGATDGTLHQALAEDGFHVIRSSFHATADSLPLDSDPEVILLILTDEDRGGVSCCRSLRIACPEAALFLVQEGITEMQEVIALEIGIDVVASRPVETRRIIAQIRALLRRQNGYRHRRPLRLQIQPATRSVVADGSHVFLTDGEFDLIKILAQHPGRPVSRETIYRRLKGLPYNGWARAIDQRICRIRRKLGEEPNDPRFIRSVRGEGYMLLMDDTKCDSPGNAICSSPSEPA